MQHTLQKIDMEKEQSGQQSRSETDQESDSYVSARRHKRKHSPETDITEMLNSFRLNINDHMTKLFTIFQESQDSKLSMLLSNINEVKQEIAEIRKINSALESKVGVLKTQVDQLQTTSNKMSSELETSSGKIKHLEDKIEQLNRQSCAFKLEMRNIPATNNESQKELKQIVEKVLATLNMKAQIPEVRSIQRMPGKSDAPRPIVVELTSVAYKSQIIQEAKKFNKVNNEKLNTAHLSIEGPVKPIYIAENLTYKAKGIYYQAREYARKHNYAFCWTKYGQVYLRKEEGTESFIVRNEEQLGTEKITSA